MPSDFDFVPQTAVSLVPSMTETLFDLGIGDRLRAVTDYCTRPADEVAKLPKVGGPKTPDLDEIIRLKPDIVLMNREENRREAVDALTEAGLTVWATEPRSVYDALNLLWDVMDVFEAPQMSARVREIERAYDYTELAMRGEDIRPLMAFVPLWKDPWITFNRETFIHDMLSVVGAHNVFEEQVRLYPLRADMGTDATQPSGQAARYPQISLDDVVAKQPEVVLLPTDHGNFNEADKATFAALDIPAARNGQIHLVDGSLLTWHGTRIATALQELPPLMDQIREALRTP
ncbi:MAG: helical backbone metal receptor [Anaerolineales bacterium]